MGGNEVTIIMRAIDQASGVIDNVKGSLEGTKRAMKEAERGSQLLLGALTGLGMVGAGIAKVGFDNNAMLENQATKWTQLTGSTEAANDVMQQFLDIQQKSPFDNKSIDQFVTSMFSLGVPVEEGIKNYSAIADTASAYGLTQDQLNRALLGASQAYSKGKLQAEEMNQMNEAGIPIQALLADSMGVTTDKVLEMAQNGEITRTEMDQLFDNMGTKYAGSMETFSGTWTGIMGRAKEAFQNFAGLLTADLFDGVKNAVGPLVDKFEELNEKFRALRESGKSTMDIIKDLIPPEMEGAIFAVTGAITVGLIPALWGIASGVWAAMAPLLPFLAVGALLGLLAFTIYKNWAKFKPFFTDAFNAVKPVVEQLTTVFQTSFQKMISYARPIWEQIKRLLVSLKPVLVLVGTALGVILGVAVAVFSGLIRAIGPFISAFLGIVDVVANVVGAIIKFLSGDLTGAQEAWGRAVESMKTIVVGIWEGIKGLISGAVDAILAILRGMGVKAPESARTAWEAVKSAISNALTSAKAFVIGFVADVIGRMVAFGTGVVSAVRTAWTNAKTTVATLINAMKIVITTTISNIVSAVIKFGSKVLNTIRNAFNNAKQAASSAWNAIKALIKTAISVIVSAVKTFGTNVLNAIKNGFNNAKNAAKTAWDAMKNFVTTGITTMISKIKGFATDVVSTIRTGFNNAKTAVSTKLDEMVGVILGFGTKFLNAGKKLISTFVDGAKSAASAIPNAVGNGLEKLRGLLPGSDAKWGPLSDLTASGAALFPTFAKGIAKNAQDAVRAASDGVGGINGQFDQMNPGISAAFNGGKATVNVRQTTKIDISGKIEVKGDSGREDLQITKSQVRDRITDGDFLRDLRQEVRKR